MQCPRCYFDNPAGSRVCEYCGARLEGTTDVGPAGGGSASQKRKTMLGPVPAVAKGDGAIPAPTRTRIDPDDPFRIAAEGVTMRTPRPPPPPTEPPRGPGSTAVPVDEPPPLPPAPVAPKPPPVSRAEPPPPPKPATRATIVTLARPEEPSVAGAAVIIPPEGPARAVVLREGRTRIGRRDGLEIAVDDPKASTDHALLRIEGGEAWLLDTSANGTTVSGVPCVNDRANVSDGAVLRVGDTMIVLKLLGEETLAHLVGDD
ncbi:MAG: FHA domain-containing protein [Alphaproteobacteria bacterium]|nr:FHA domain-containing protein [Alphaproteobacteria bacterium]